MTNHAPRRPVGLPWWPRARYAVRTDRPWWRRLLVFPCWCITHKPADCQGTWRREFPDDHPADWLDQYFPQTGPCGLCGVPGAQQRHRVLDAIHSRLAAGEGAEDVADDYSLPVWVVERVGAEWTPTLDDKDQPSE